MNPRKRASQGVVDRKRRARMDAIDQMPVAIRELVHEYGLNSVKTLMDLGVVKPNQIKHVIETILDEFSPTRGSYSGQGPRISIRSLEMTGRNQVKG